MKLSLVFILSLLFIASCGRNNDDNNRFVNGVNAFGQPCSLNTVNNFNTLNGFYNNTGYGVANPYQLELARRCGLAINNGFNNFNNINGVNNNGCFVPSDMQNVNGINSINSQQVEAFNAEFTAELEDVHGIYQPHTGQEESYYTQVGFQAGVYTGGGYGYGYPVGAYSPQFGYGYCDLLQRSQF